MIQRLTIFLVSALSVHAQSFRNLDFEQANVSGYSQGSGVPIAQALPGWSATFINSGAVTPDTEVSYDGVSTGGPGLALLDSKVGTLQGNYSLYIYGGPSTDCEISQTGLIPAGTKSITMEASLFNSSPVVAIDGQPIQLYALQTLPSYTIYGGNISAYAGQVETLSLTDPSPPSDPPSMFLVDDITFSTSSAPEPSSTVFVAVSGLFFAFHRKGIRKVQRFLC